MGRETAWVVELEGKDFIGILAINIIYPLKLYISLILKCTTNTH